VDQRPLEAVTLIIPYYRNVGMLEKQLQTLNVYGSGMRVIVVDDGSPEPALPIIQAQASRRLLEQLQLYRIGVDIPWNREGARNLGAHVATTEWIVQIDIDHVLPVQSADLLLDFAAAPGTWYRFPRWRVGRADETRRKDQIPDQCLFGQIHAHVDSYLIERALYWQVGGYDEDFAGCLGGGSDFLRRLERAAPLKMLPPDIQLHVHTRSVVKDASDWSLSRDTSEGKRRAREKRARRADRPQTHMRFAWSRQL
jgi:hypothetical protein